MNRFLNFLKGKWLGHPLHPILVHVPMAMWPGALIFDLLSKWQIGGNAMVRLSFYAIVFGLLASLLAVPAGVVDWSGIKKEKPAWKIGLYHMPAFNPRHGSFNRLRLFGRNDDLHLRHQRRTNVER